MFVITVEKSFVARRTMPRGQLSSLTRLAKLFRNKGASKVALSWYFPGNEKHRLKRDERTDDNCSTIFLSRQRDDSLE